MSERRIYMCKIYIDFDGVLVDTPRLIVNELKDNGYSVEACQKFPWNSFLQKCNEIENNISYIQEISRKYEVIIITHVYSDNERLEKEKYIFEKLSGIKLVTVPYNIAKSDVVDAKKNILIDDYKNNIDTWVESGGIGICVTDEKRIDILLAQYLVVSN